MKPKTIIPVKRLSGRIVLPGDKSISHRAVMLGAIAKGETRVRGLLDCDDCNFTIGAFKHMGVDIKTKGDVTIIKGKGLDGLEAPKGPIYLGDSGTSMRILSGILAGQDFEATLEGDESLSRRPMERIVEPLSLMGVDIRASEGNLPPIKIRGGRLNTIDYKMPVPSAQVKSAILFAGLYADGVTKVREPFKSRDHTERMMKYFGADISVEGLQISVKGKRELKARSLEVPGDISSASFFMVGAALIPGSKVRICNVSINPTRSGIIKVLSMMGAKIKILKSKDIFEPFADIEVGSSSTKGIVIEEGLIPNIIDELPIIFVLAALSRGKTVIEGAKELRVKETDRINSMKHNLENMGARLKVEGDSIVIEGTGSIKGAALRSFGDHRTCMAMAIAALAAKGESTIDDASCIRKSFPGFFKALDGIIR